MNLWARNLGLLLMAALTLSSCEEEIGQNFLNPENNLGIFFAEYPIEDKIGQVWTGGAESSSRTNEPTTTVLAGHLQDSVFGNINATPYFGYRVPLISPLDTLFETAIIEDYGLSFRITDAFGEYTDTDIQNFAIYSTDYPTGVETSATTQQLSELIGTMSFNLYKDSISLELGANVDTSLYDANNLYVYQKRIEFEDSFINGLESTLQQAALDGRTMTESIITDPEQYRDSVTLYTAIEIIEQLRGGFAIVPDEGNTAILSFQRSSMNFNLEWKSNYVDTLNNAQIREDNIEFALDSYNYISPNENEPWSGGVFNGLSETNEIFKTANEYAYFQSGSNMFITIDMSDLPSLEDSIPNAVISGARLRLENIFDVEPSLPLPGAVRVYQANESQINAGNLINITEDIPFNEINALPQVIYNATDNAFEIAIPNYLQGTIDGANPFDHLVIAFPILFRDTFIGGFVIRKEDISLKYYYTTTN